MFSYFGCKYIALSIKPFSALFVYKLLLTKNYYSQKVIKMKKLLLMCCVLMGISAISFAQNNRPNQNNRGMRTPTEQANQLKESLKLNDEQSAKIKTIYEGQSKSMDSLRTALAGDRSGMREKMMPIITTTTDKIKAVLTPEQATAFQKQLDERMSRMRRQ
jgi:Spy/CpxP family protein refolding chaperone